MLLLVIETGWSSKRLFWEKLYFMETGTYLHGFWLWPVGTGNKWALGGEILGLTSFTITLAPCLEAFVEEEKSLTVKTTSICQNPH
jgi:hypothetical protein